MKKLLAPVVLAMALLLGGCSGADSSASNLTGTWVQKSTTGDSGMQAVINQDSISIDVVSDGGDSRSIYWKGSFDPELGGEDAATIVSERDSEAMNSAWLASSADSKEFTYENGELSYEQSAMGTTSIIRLEKQES